MAAGGGIREDPRTRYPRHQTHLPPPHSRRNLLPRVHYWGYGSNGSQEPTDDYPGRDNRRRVTPAVSRNDQDLWTTDVPDKYAADDGSEV